MHLGPGAGRGRIRGWAGGAPHSPCPASGFTVATDSFQVPTPWERSPASPASPSQPYILLHMPIWSRPALWNVKKYVFLGWDPHAGTHQHWPKRRLWRNGASLGLVKRNQINLQLDLVPFNQLQRRMRYGTRCALAAPAWRGCRRLGWMHPALRGLGVRSGGKGGLQNGLFGWFLKLPGGGEAARRAAPPLPAGGNCAAQTAHAACSPRQKPQS